MSLFSKINFKLKDITLLTLVVSAFYFVSTVYFYYGHDEYYYIFTAIQLIEEKSIIVPLDSPFFRYRFLVPTTTPNEYISMYPIGQSLLIAIFYLIGGYHSIYYMNGVFTIFSVILTYLSAFEISKKRLSSLLSGILLGICPPIVFHSRTLLSDLPSMTFLLLSFFFYIRTLKKHKNTFYVISSVSLGFAVLLRYPNIFFLLPIFAHQIRSRKLNELSTYIYYIPLIPFLCIIGLYNYHFFGSVFTTGYHLSGYVFHFSFTSTLVQFPQYFLIFNLFPPVGLITAVLYFRKKLDDDASFISFFVILTFIIFYSAYSYLPFDIEYLFVESTRYLLVILPYLCINSVLWFRDRIKNKTITYSIPTVVFVTFIIINLVMIARFNAFKLKLVYYRDLFYDNTEPDSLIIGSSIWDKLFYPLQNYTDRYYIRYTIFTEDRVVDELLPFVDEWIADKPVYFIDDPYEGYNDRDIHDLILQFFFDKYLLESVVSTDHPYIVELYEIKPH